MERDAGKKNAKLDGPYADKQKRSLKSANLLNLSLCVFEVGVKGSQMKLHTLFCSLTPRSPPQTLYVLRSTWSMRKIEVQRQNLG